MADKYTLDKNSMEKDFYDKSILKYRDKLYKAITIAPKNLKDLRFLMLNEGLNESKIQKTIELLKSSDRVIMSGGYIMAKPAFIKKGVFYARGSNRYVVLEGENRQYAISLDDSAGYLSNENVNVAFYEDEDEDFQRPFIVSKYVGEETSILKDIPKNDNNTIYGRVIKVSHDKLIFISKDKRFSKGIEILNQKNTLSQYQDKICIMQLDCDERSANPCGYITEIIGDAGNPIHEYEAIAQAHGAIMSWSDEKVLNEINKLPKEVDLTGKKLVDEKGNILQHGKGKIVDLRELSFTTVDPANCRDMDDAIYSTFDEDGRLVIYTAVANVTKYVDLNSEIGKRYIKGGFTTYAPNRAYNILPPELSTGLCSLNPNVDRLALVIKSVIDEETGYPISSTIYDAVINSKEKFSYMQAQEICDKSNLTFAELKDRHSNRPLTIDEQVVLNEQASQILWKGFNKRNFINFETKNEYDVVFNDDLSEIVDIEPQENCDYHKVIEAFMLTANEISARFSKTHNLPNIYRIHEKPNEDKIAQAFEFFDNLNVPFDGDLSPFGIKKLVESVKGTSKEKAVNNFLVRLQSRAKYSNSTVPNSAEYIKLESRKRNKKRTIAGKKKLNLEEDLNKADNEEIISHFGLQSKAYSHTTSPIRRISDYVTHKNILAYLNGEKYINERLTSEIAGWANQRQNIVKKAEREFDEVNSAIYCEAHIGEVMKGYVSGFKKLVVYDEEDRRIESFCVIVENEEKGIKVMIPANELLPEGVKNIGLSRYGSAIINRNSHAPLIKLCEDVTFKLQSADRVTRIVTATTDLEKSIDLKYDYFKE